MKRVLVQVDEGTHVAWKARAFSEGRSMSELARDLIERAVLTGRDQGRRGVAVGLDAAVPTVSFGGGSTASLSPSGDSSRRSVSADVAATIPGVTVASAVCLVCPPGRSRPACSLPVKHDGKHSWEVS